MYVSSCMLYLYSRRRSTRRHPDGSPSRLWSAAARRATDTRRRAPVGTPTSSASTSMSGGGDRPPPALDFASFEFDPALALRRDSGAIPPRPRARALDTVRQCRKLLPASSEGASDGAREASSRGVRLGRDARSFAAQARARQRAEKFIEQRERFASGERVFDRLANTKNARVGPLRVLRDARERRARVTIVTRHARGVRGVATAYVEAFDKFANMVLTDVEETYTVRTKTATEKRTTAKLDHRTRHIQQVFLRGEQVVSISVPSAVAARAP